MTNGADINMNGSTGSTIIFPDGTIQRTATVAGPQGDPGADGADGSDGAPGTDGAAGTVGADSFVGGGGGNTASDDFATVGGGYENEASQDYATVGGGFSNTASGLYSTVGRGWNNDAQAQYSTISGGGPWDQLNNPTTTNNRVTDDYGTIGGGGNNQAGDNGGEVDDAPYATVAGGHNNRASGDYSFAIGRRAKIAAAHDGTFMFADSTYADFISAAANEFAVRANGGVRFITDSDISAGVGLGTGDTSWNVLSAKDLKENYTHVDSVHILEQVVELPIERWNYRHQDDSVKHIGPYAEDFHAAFGLHGESNRTISSQDLDGVALAAIQGLNQKLMQELADVRAEKQAEIDRLKKEFSEQFASLEQRLLAMEASMN